MTYQSPNHKENVKRYREKNKDKILDNGKTRYRNDSKRYLYHMLKRAEKRAIEKNIPFDLKPDDVIIPELCPILGVKMTIGDGKGPHSSSPSLDRIVPSLGYVKGNVLVISMRANKIKSDGSLEDIEKVYNYLKNHHSLNTL
jgi:hypothetical protein